MSPPSHPSPPPQSLTTPPASSTSSPPAATSHGDSPSSKNPSNTPSATHARSSEAAPGLRRSSNVSRHRRIASRYRGSTSFFRNGNPVATTALSAGDPDTESREPSSPHAPRPRPPIHIEPRNGAWTAAATGRPSSTRATDTPTAQNPCTKFVVPSRGSTTQ